MKKNLLRILPVIFAVILLTGIGIANLRPAYTPRGSVIAPPLPAPEIRLFDFRGDPFALSDLRGRIVLLFFGYTHCPDICPATLADMKVVFEQLGQSAPEVAFIFVTVDAARDTPERLAAYLSGFHPDFIGLTGTAEALELVYRDYQVGVSQAPSAGAPGYEVEHISRIFVIDRAGRLVETFPYGLGRELILQDIEHLLANDGF